MVVGWLHFMLRPQFSDAKLLATTSNKRCNHVPVAEMQSSTCMLMQPFPAHLQLTLSSKIKHLAFAPSAAGSAGRHPHHVFQQTHESFKLVHHEI